jgi:hypothetical protein
MPELVRHARLALFRGLAFGSRSLHQEHRALREEPDFIADSAPVGDQRGNSRVGSKILTGHINPPGGRASLRNQCDWVRPRNGGFRTNHAQ